MSSFAILGATGKTGSSLLQLLLGNPDNKLHLYVRSRSKLLKLQPAIEEKSKFTIYEGDLEDVELLGKCIAGTKAVFLAVASSENLPGCTIAVDTANVVVKALKRTQTQDRTSKTPKVIVLSSSSVTDEFWRGVPRIVHNTLFNANYHIYIDLQKAEKHLREQEEWLTSIFVKPGGLVKDVQRGYKLSLEEMHTFMSFLDLAAAMIEVAETDGDRWNMKDVSIIPQTSGARFEWKAPYVLSKGLLAYFFPQLYIYVRAWLP